MSLADLLSSLRNPPPLLAKLRDVPGLHLVGGFLREAWYGRASRDIDLAVEGDLAPVLRALEAATGSKAFELGQRFSSYRITDGGFSVDVSPMHPGGLRADLARRDYTVNTLAVALSRIRPGVSAEDVQCHAAAFDDLDAGVLRMVSREGLRDDPARILRGYRLAATCGFTPDGLTRQAWRELASTLVEAAPERLHEELLRWFSSPTDLAPTLKWCADDAVLWELFPDLRATIGCAQNDFHHLDVWEHTLEALSALDAVVAEPPPALAPWHAELSQAWSSPISGMATAGTLTRLAMLLHDIAKPPTRHVQADGHVTFYGHQEMGAGMVAQGLQALKFSTDETDFIILLILEHLRLGFYCEYDPLPPRLIYRFLTRLGQAAPLMLLHNLADCAATRGERSSGSLEQHTRAAREILSHYYRADTVAAPPVLLDGHAIMELLGLPPGKLVGRLKDALLEATASGEVLDVEQAREYVRKLRADAAGESAADAAPPPRQS